MKMHTDRTRADRASTKGRRLRAPLFAVVAVVVALLAGALAGGGFAATTTKPYAIDIAPHTVPAGSSTAFTATLKNEASPQSLGSVNITAPATFTVTAAAVLSAPAGATATRVGNTVQLRNLSLPPSGIATLSITATVPCTPATGNWAVTAKQSNDYNGPPGNDFTPNAAHTNTAVSVTGAGGCHLHFFKEPADAEINTAIASTPFNTTGATSVQVEVLDGAEQRVTSSTAPITIALNSGTAGAVLTGDNATITKNAVAGVAGFSNLKIDTHGNYTLIATAPGITQAISNAAEADHVFTIWDNAELCTANKTCNAPVGDPNQFQSTFSGTSSTGGFLLVTLGQDTLSCGDTYNHAPSVTTFTTYQFSATGNKTIVGRIDKTIDQLQSNNGVSFYRVCFESPDFTFTYPGGVVKPAGTPFILPDCKAVGTTPPCVKSITKTNAGDVLETITLPPYDVGKWR